MPLLDHFHPPIFPQHRWESFHANWATRLADGLTARLPAEFIVEEHCHSGPNLEIDVATHEKVHDDLPAAGTGAAVDTLTLPTWAPPAAAYTMPVVFPETFEVRIFSTVTGLNLVGAIELISPGNKDRPEERRAFATKCASYLHRGVSLILMDVVTSRRANMHNETMRLMEANPKFELPDEARLYAVAYRPVRRHDRSEIDIWPATFSIGESLPTMPLRLTGDLFVAVEFEAAYQEACQRRRLA